MDLKTLFSIDHHFLIGERILQAYILITTQPGKPWKVADATLKIEGVKMAHAVSGPFDVVAYVEFVKMESLGALIEKVHFIDGVLGTQTAIVMPPRL